MYDRIKSLNVDEIYTYEAEDAADFIFTNDLVQINNLLVDFEPFSVTKDDFLYLLKSWIDFLDAYRNAQIPLIIPKGTEGQWEIVHVASTRDKIVGMSNRDTVSSPMPIPDIFRKKRNSLFEFQGFWVRIDPKGNQKPGFSIMDLKYDYLSVFFTNKIPTKVKAQEFYDQLSALSPDGTLVIEVPEQLFVKFTQSEVWITIHSGEFEPFQLPMSYFVELLEDWISFLDYYESGKIPGLIPTVLKDELVIVRKGM